MKHPRQFQGASVHQLVLAAYSMVRGRFLPVSIASISFALLLATVSTYVNGRVDDIQQDIASKAGLTTEALMEKVAVWATETSDLDLLRFATDPERAISFVSAPTEENAPMLVVLRTGPYVLGILLFDLIVLLVAFVYFLTYFSDPLLTPFDAAKRLPASCVRLVLLFVWMLIRSFSWIPLAGPLLALYFFPRFALAPVLVASKDSGVRESIHISMARTSGQWFAVFVRLAVLALLMASLLWFVIVIASILSLFVLKIGFLVWLFGLFFIIACEAAYFVVLTAILA